MEQQAIQSVNEISQITWLLHCVVLVILMQVGFLCLEAGCILKKNNINAAIKSVINLCVVFSIFFLSGYSLMYGVADKNGLVGELSWFLNGIEQQQLPGFLLQAAFCSVSVAIVAGGIAERCKFLPFIMIAAAVALFIYPVFGHWVWGGGWLYKLGFYDFAGASVVHILGAGVALAGIRVLGPRKSRLNQQGNLIEVVGPNPPMYAMGVLILFVGWFGIVGGMVGASQQLISIVINTVVAAAFGGLTALLSTWAYLGLANINYFFRGLLGALVAITASAEVVSAQSAMMIGILSGGIVPLALAMVQYFKLDDATGVVSVHGVAGILGIILVPVFIQPEAMQILNQTMQQQHDGWSFLAVQFSGAVICALWGYITGLLMLKLFKTITIFELRPEQEKIGLNYTEHMSSHPLHDLNTAIDLIRQEQVLEAKTHFDRLENSDLEGLSVALRELMNREHRQD